MKETTLTSLSSICKKTFRKPAGGAGIFLFLIPILLISIGCTQTEPVGEFERTEEEGYRWAELVAGNEQPGLEKLSSSLTGITIRNDLADKRMSENRILMNGSGVAASDINGDGFWNKNDSQSLKFSKKDQTSTRFKRFGMSLFYISI